MQSASDPSPTSAKSNRILWILIAVLSGITFGYRLWNRLHEGGFDLVDWGGLLSPLGVFTMAAGSLADPGRGRLYRVSLVVAFTLIVTGLFLVLLT
jgi:hypothetical protein